MTPALRLANSFRTRAARSLASSTCVAYWGRARIWSAASPPVDELRTWPSNGRCGRCNQPASVRPGGGTAVMSPLQLPVLGEGEGAAFRRGDAVDAVASGT